MRHPSHPPFRSPPRSATAVPQPPHKFDEEWAYVDAHILATPTLGDIDGGAAAAARALPPPSLSFPDPSLPTLRLLKPSLKPTHPHNRPTPQNKPSKNPPKTPPKTPADGHEELLVPVSYFYDRDYYDSPARAKELAGLDPHKYIASAWGGWGFGGVGVGFEGK